MKLALILALVFVALASQVQAQSSTVVATTEYLTDVTSNQSSSDSSSDSSSHSNTDTSPDSSPDSSAHGESTAESTHDAETSDATHTMGDTTSTTPRTTTEKPESVVFSCSFDQDFCGFFVDSFSEKYLSIEKEVDAGTHVFSDASHLYLPAANGESCKIPFNNNGQEYFRCDENNECMTDSGLSKCAESGNYLSAVSTVDAFYAEAVPTSPIRLKALGVYRVSFYAYIYCDDKNCKASKDFIKFYFYIGETLIDFITIDVDIDDFEDTKIKGWKKFEELLPFQKSNEIYTYINFGRDSRGPPAFMGLDDFKIELVQEATLEPTTEKTTTKLPDIGEVVYLCDFDEDESFCGADIVGEDLEDILSFKKQLQVNGKTYTDRSSITLPTSNGQTCNIPYLENDKENFHCNADNQCQTNNGLATCEEGFFLAGQSPISGSAFYADVRFPKIKVRPSAAYRFSAWAFVDCDGLACETAKDFINILVKYDDRLFAEINILSTDVVFDEAWRYFSVEFESTQVFVDVVIELGRNEQANRIQTAFGLDEMKIEYLGEKITTTAAPTKTTTTTRSPELVKLVYKCDFDRDDCDITIPDESKEYLQVKSTSLVAGYTFTDFLSITGLTGIGLACQIPFSLDNNEYYHCTSENTCLTAAGVAQCQSGRFLEGRSSPSGANNYASVVFRGIQLPQAGRYRFSVWVYYYCLGISCSNARDFAKFFLNHGENLVLDTAILNINFATLTGSRGWTKFSIDFTSRTDYVALSLDAGRDDTTPRVQSFYGFDQIELEFIELEAGDSIFNCDFNFDGSFCGAELSGEDLEDILSFKKQLQVNGKTYTDRSSITLPTSNGQTCNIPYLENGKENFHCNADNQCQTNNGTAKCFEGYFLAGKSPVSGAPFYAEVHFPKIKVPESGAYRFDAWAFVDCDGLGCETSKDFINIQVKYDDRLFGEINILSTDVVFDEAWRYFSFEFESDGNDIEIVFELGRNELLGRIQTAFGIDDLSIEYIGKAITTLPTEPTTRTTTRAPVELAYECNFDRDDCNINVPEEYAEYLSIKSSVLVEDYTFTDFTSITGLTGFAVSCIIPYTINEVEYYHCNKDGACLTDAGLSKCQDGRYLEGRSSPSGATNYATVVFGAIPLKQIGRYRFTVWAYYYCGALSCSTARDFVKFFFNYGPNLVFDTEVLTINFGNLSPTKAWRQFEIEFDVTSDSIGLSMDAGRDDTTPRSQSFYGIDQLELEYLGPSEKTTTTTTTQTTTTTTTTATPTTTTTTTTAAPVTTTTTSTTTTTTLSFITQIVTKPQSKGANLAVILPAVLVPSAVVLTVVAILIYMKTSRKGCFKQGVVDPDVEMY